MPIIRAGSYNFLPAVLAEFCQTETLKFEVSLKTERLTELDHLNHNFLGLYADADARFRGESIRPWTTWAT